jgi:hypothetical protein
MKKQKLDSAAALAVYMGARPFALWECKYMRHFIDLLLDSLYQPPSRRAISGDLLEEAYNEVLEKVISLLNEQESLQLS